MIFSKTAFDGQTKIKSALFFFVVIGCLRAGPVLAQQQTESFFIDPTYDYAGRTEALAYPLVTTEHAYVYVERDWWQTLNAPAEVQARSEIAKVINEFNTRIYPLITTAYGSEWRPGIDNDERLTIFFTQMRSGVAGYFNAADEQPTAIIANSNQREMLYLSTRFLGDTRLKAFLAHEFQHLITNYQKTEKQNLYEETWLNEARSEYAPTLLGYDDSWDSSNLVRRVEEFLNSPSDSLTEWRNDFPDYGVANIFMQYFIDHYGANTLKLMTQNNQVGILSIDNALLAGGAKKDFSDVFTDWSVAVFLNDCAIRPVNLYCFQNKNLGYNRLHLNLSLVDSGQSVSQQAQLKDWAAAWYQVDYNGMDKNLRVEFSSPSPQAAFRVPYILIYEDGLKEVRELVMAKTDSGQRVSALIEDFGHAVQSAIFIPHNEYKQAGFSNNESGVSYNLDFSLVAKGEAVLPPPAPTPSAPVVTVPDYPDGSLLRQQGDFKVYVISGRYKRWLQAPAILGMYPHFGWQKVIEVTPAKLAYYQDAWLVRAAGDTRVYEINGDGTKHWLNMTAEWFSQSGRQWETVYIINSAELNWYRTGSDVLQ
ncbi:MAG: hypothetical protein COU85_01850 [Candidatus Portnoybacteria bacterium CG10_big_fil_rev_8_21_14_0_10_44_7]|uniref:Uncharacterized protein n=1 Tax=Candidatus Portnoybacteria bacterium CG10_big_fil_rev_8_21_14_0_10_44_7 TaxID=1974816 RepID=A0A2M8KIP3_9BACT|nr:MAG: hypothetical protein COU85_01850 [Candidatus Portnoybacteria bacterium CG10_big_fil_rev_8_21_14_0_10_44_7]